MSQEQKIERVAELLEDAKKEFIEGVKVGGLSIINIVDRIDQIIEYARA